MSRHLLLARQCQPKATESTTRPPRISTYHTICSRKNRDHCSLVLSDCFNQTLEHRVITFILSCLASIDATLTAIVGDRLLLYWYSTIARSVVCVPTSKRTGFLSCQQATVYIATQLDHYISTTRAYCQFLFTYVLPLTCLPIRSMTGLDHPLSLPKNPTLVNILNKQAGEANDKDAGTDPNGQDSRGV